MKEVRNNLSNKKNKERKVRIQENECEGRKEERKRLRKKRLNKGRKKPFWGLNM